MHIEIHLFMFFKMRPVAFGRYNASLNIKAKYPSEIQNVELNLRVPPEMKNNFSFLHLSQLSAIILDFQFLESETRRFHYQQHPVRRNLLIGRSSLPKLYYRCVQ